MSLEVGEWVCDHVLVTLVVHVPSINKKYTYHNHICSLKVEILCEN